MGSNQCGYLINIGNKLIEGRMYLKLIITLYSIRHIIY